MTRITLDNQLRLKRISKSPKTPIVFAPEDSVQSVEMECNGLLHTVVLELPSFLGAAQGTLTISDGDGYELFNSTAKNRGTTTVIKDTTTLIPLCGLVTVTLTLSGLSGSDATAYFTAYFA